MALTIDGGLINELTIDGTKVREVTIDGEFVFGEIGETGTVSVSDTVDQGVVASPSFNKTYTNPAVVAYIPTRNGSQSIVYRARNVTSTGCDLFMEEPDAQGHNSETISYIVMEEGTWQFPDGTLLEVGTHTTSAVRSSANGSTFGDSISFTQSFSSAPAVLHTLNTHNNSDFMASQANSITSTDFNLSQEAAETGTSSASETIAWIAIETGTGTNNGYAYEAQYASDGSNDGVDDTPHTISFAQSFASTPDISVSQQTMNGGDGSWARGSGTQWNTSGHETYAEEDQITDAERTHADETFAWFATEPNAILYGHS